MPYLHTNIDVTFLSQKYIQDELRDYEIDDDYLLIFSVFIQLIICIIRVQTRPSHMEYKYSPTVIYHSPILINKMIYVFKV